MVNVHKLIGLCTRIRSSFRPFSTKKPNTSGCATSIKPPSAGYDLVLFRVASIVENIAERLNSRVLHFHCESDFVRHFDDSKGLAIEGVSDNDDTVQAVKSNPRYQEVNLLDYNAKLYDMFRPSSFEFIVSIPPLNREQKGPSMSEILRLLNQRGYGVIGAHNSIWERDLTLQLLKDLDAENRISLLSLQSVPCEVVPNKTMDYHIAVFRKT